jgi:hypothetical protein
MRAFLGYSAITRYFGRLLLRACHGRPNGCGAEKRDEVAALHSITLQHAFSH